jgi:DNA-binding MarR family transcriptional regulator
MPDGVPGGWRKLVRTNKKPSLSGKLASLPVYLLFSHGMAKESREETATELALALGLLVRRLRRAAPSETDDLTWAQKAVMVRLDTEGPATTAELARAEGVKPQSMGATVAVLEERGMVEREPHPTDGRQIHIALTAKGASIRKNTGAAKRTWLAQAIAKLDATDRKTLPAATALIKRLGEL